MITAEVVDVGLQSVYPALPDIAGFAERFHQSFMMSVFTAGPPRQLAYGEYDHGQDALTESLTKQGVWEGQESTLAVDILASTPGVVLDFGAHIGWYTVLAGLFGQHPVIAYEPDAQNVELLRLNADRHGVKVSYQPGVDEHFSLSLDEDVAFLKCDIEGYDCYAIGGCSSLFQSHRIRYALVEVSPIFTADGRSPCDYVTMVGALLGHGYSAYRIPPKGWVHNPEYRDHPLETLKAYCQLGDDWAEVVANCRQDNFVFIRPEDL